MKRAILPLILLGFAAMAQAQPVARSGKVETVIVPGEKPPAAIAHDYIGTYAAPTPFLGKMARWDKRIPLCPNAFGFSPAYDLFITKRIKDIAAMVGAPVNTQPACKPNMAIIVTNKSQGLLDVIRAQRSDLLGYFSSLSQADHIAVVQYPIEAWYETATVDDNGGVHREMIDDPACGFEPCNYVATGQRARDGLSSIFYNVTIVADSSKIAGYQLGALADYLAMLALSETGNFAACQALPSITSLMSPDCANRGITNEITGTDLAYLRGVYKIDPGANLNIQQSTIAGEITKSLEGR